jgi:Cof subfamily protein (haloacid dehalogenase superfamily)
MKFLPRCESTRWTSLFTDVVPMGISKRVGIDKMLEHFQIGLDECMAFGDGGNDIQMLSHVGIGIAMGNASDEVKKYADYITDSVDEDGVFKALKHFNVI